MMTIKFIGIMFVGINAILATLNVLPNSPFVSSLASTRSFEKRSLSNGVALRILPLGDSITWGFQSTSGNGYRDDLLTMLSGNPVQYIGSQRSGDMIDNFNEGHPGATISEIAGYATNSLPERPNVILLMAGTNDCNGDVDPAGAPARLGSLIDECVSACPDATILVAQLTPIANQAAEALVQTFNAAVPGVVAARANAGKHVLTVDMSSYVPASDLYDGLHPDDVGYNLMAECWYAGLQQAAAKGWISAPVASTAADRAQGACLSGLFWDPEHGEIASGAGSGDASFKAAWSPEGILASGNVGQGSAQGLGVRLADMFGNGIDSYLYVNATSGAVILYSNAGYSAGKISWINWGEIASGIGDGPGVMFADLDGDGLDDYIWVSTSGSVTAYRNGGPGSGGPGAKTWIWYPLGTISSGLGGGTRTSIRFADIDGDGRAEYHVIGTDGSVTSWLNSGYDAKPVWESMGKIASGTGSSDLQGVHLVDLNGDGKADYVWLDSNGKATAYINYRGHNSGLAPIWVSEGVIATGIGVKRQNVTFGDLTGDGKAEYIGVNYTTGALNVYLNGCSGGTYETADGLTFADIDGNGLDDYLWIDKISGAITAYLNGGWDSAAQKQVWYPQDVIATGTGSPRENIRMADLDGDGLADYCVVDDVTGAVTLWLNGNGKPGNWIWYPRGEVASGIGAGAGVRLADLDGDGRADYLWVDKNGSVIAYINGGYDTAASKWLWYPQGMIASGVGAAREDVRFADINGDGKVDYLWVDRLTGSVNLWYNGGGLANNWIWYPAGEVATGVGANGLSIMFADTTGSGRDDYLDVIPFSGAVNAWLNGCSGGTAAGSGGGGGGGVSTSVVVVTTTPVVTITPPRSTTTDVVVVTSTKNVPPPTFTNLPPKDTNGNLPGIALGQSQTPIPNTDCGDEGCPSSDESFLFQWFWIQYYTSKESDTSMVDNTCYQSIVSWPNAPSINNQLLPPTDYYASNDATGAMTGISVYGDTCSYVPIAEPTDQVVWTWWDNLNDHTNVGTLQCSKLANAGCYKSSGPTNCCIDGQACVTEQRWMVCFWDLAQEYPTGD